MPPSKEKKELTDYRLAVDKDNREALEAMRQRQGISVERLANMILRSAIAAEIEITSKQKPVIEMEDGRILQARQRIAFKL